MREKDTGRDKRGVEGSGKLVLKLAGRLASKMVGGGRLAPQTVGIWEVGPTNGWEMGG